MARRRPAAAREAALVVLAGGRTYEAIVSLGGVRCSGLAARPGRAGRDHGRRVRRVRGWRSRPTRRFRAALALRGVTDLDLVMVDTVVGRAASRSPAGASGARWPWLRSDLTGDNGYARPIGGLLAIVDLDAHAGRRASTTTARAAARRARRLPRRRRAALPRRPAADRGRAARGLEPAPRRPARSPGAVARCASASTRASR